MLTVSMVSRLAGITQEEVSLAMSNGALDFEGIDSAGNPLFSLADVRDWVSRGRPLDDLDQIC